MLKIQWTEKLTEYITAVSWSKKGDLAVSSADGEVMLFTDTPHLILTPNDTQSSGAQRAFGIDHLAFSADSQFLAVGGQNGQILIWQLSGFSGKVRNLTWSRIIPENAPLLATSSRGNVLVWQKEKIAEKGWNATILNIDDRIIQDLQFNPHNLLLAGGNEEGCLFLWENEEQLMDNFTGIEGGFSCLQWDFSGRKLAVGSDMGEVFIFM